jgi:hypothetical protein
MVHKCNLAEVEGHGVASLCEGSMRDQVSMRVCIVAYASLYCSLYELDCLGDALGGFIYAAS